MFCIATFKNQKINTWHYDNKKTNGCVLKIVSVNSPMAAIVIFLESENSGVICCVSSAVFRAVCSGASRCSVLFLKGRRRMSWRLCAGFHSKKGPIFFLECILRRTHTHGPSSSFCETCWLVSRGGTPVFILFEQFQRRSAFNVGFPHPSNLRPFFVFLLLTFTAAAQWHQGRKCYSKSSSSETPGEWRRVKV